ncbi:hypothetical protein [Cryobacterium sp. Y57]|uniref:hypothetical protein n=1 Tax=Cryobacterium sp. Y57 TaxID=2048287 RepID=UPI000CE485A0|nr:hypothetical protein [Cryobacterium sp. Y57]
MTFDLTAPVARFGVGDHVSWIYQSVKPVFGTIRRMDEHDARGGEDGSLTSFDGLYYGRRVYIECDSADCHVNCETDGWLHCCNECQLTIEDGSLPQLTGALF